MFNPKMVGQSNEEMGYIEERVFGSGAVLLAMATTFLPCKLELGENVVVYNPQLVLRKFGYD